MHVGFNYEMEDLVESSNKIGERILSQMQIEDQNGVLVYNDPNVKKTSFLTRTTNISANMSFKP